MNLKMAEVIIAIQFSMSSPRARLFVKKWDNSRTWRRVFEQKYATYLYKRMGRRLLLNYMVR